MIMNCNWLWPCDVEEKRSENVDAIKRNVDDFMWKVRDVESIENQEKYTLAFFAKLGGADSIEKLAEMSIDMQAALQKIKLKKDEEADDNKDETFIELFSTKNVTKTKEDME